MKDETSDAGKYEALNRKRKTNAMIIAKIMIMMSIITMMMIMTVIMMIMVIRITIIPIITTITITIIMMVLFATKIIIKYKREQGTTEKKRKTEGKQAT